MMTLNDRRVLHSGTAVLRAGETLKVDGYPILRFVTREASQPVGISVVPVGADFQVGIDGFTPGTSLTSMARGTLANGTEIVITTIVDRIAEMSDTPIYRIQFMMSEGR